MCYKARHPLTWLFIINVSILIKERPKYSRVYLISKSFMKSKSAKADSVI